MIAERLHQTFPEAKILIVIREQNDLLKSYYKQYVRGGGVLKLRDYLNMKWRAPYFPKFNLLQYDFYQLVALYRDLYGSDRVLFLPYEWLRQKPERFVDQVFQFAGVNPQGYSPSWDKKIYQSLDYSAIWYMRWINILAGRRSNALNPNPLIKSNRLYNFRPSIGLGTYLDKKTEQHYEQVIDEVVGSFFGQSNLRLQELSPIDFRELGYFMDNE